VPVVKAVSKAVLMIVLFVTVPVLLPVVSDFARLESIALFVLFDYPYLSLAFLFIG